MPEARVVWTNDKQFVAESGSGHAVVLDAGPEVGGRATGASPIELVLMALAGCTAFDVVLILNDKMKRKLTALSVAVAGERAEVSPKVYTRIELRYQLRGPELPEKDALRAIKLSLEKYCAVSAMLERTAELVASYELVDESTGQIHHGPITIERE